MIDHLKPRKRGNSELKESPYTREPRKSSTLLAPNPPNKNHNFSATKSKNSDLDGADSQRASLISNRPQDYQLPASVDRQSAVGDAGRLSSLVYLEQMTPMDQSSIRGDRNSQLLADKNNTGQLGLQAESQFVRLKSGSYMSRSGRKLVDIVRDIEEDEENFYLVYKEVYEHIEVPERIEQYRNTSKRGKMVYIARFVLVTFFLMAIGMIDFSFTFLDRNFFKKTIVVLHNIGSLQTNIGSIFTSAYMAASTMQSEWIYKGSPTFN